MAIVIFSETGITLNGMQRLVNYQSGLTANGTYCAIQAINPVNTPFLAIQGKVLTINAMLENATLYCSAAAGTTGGAVVPVMLGADGNYYPLATTTTLTASGFGFFIQIATSAIGLAIQITTPIVGGSVFLSVEALQV
jgi:hypothetical protein